MKNDKEVSSAAQGRPLDRFGTYLLLTQQRALSTAVGAEEGDSNSARLFALVGGSLLAGGFAYALLSREEGEAWLFRDDIGSPHGIKGYEEQVNSVGAHHGHCYWPSEESWSTYNSAT